MSDNIPILDVAEFLAALTKVSLDHKRRILLDFCRWLEKDEFGEGREEEIVDRYLREQEGG